MLGEDVEDQRGPVDDLDLEPLLQLTELAGRELAVADHGVGAGGADGPEQLLDLAGADERGRVRAGAALDEAVHHLGTGGLGEAGQLGHRVLGLLGRALGPDADEHDPLQLELAVLDLGDVGELGGQPVDPAQRRALLQVELATRRNRVRRGGGHGGVRVGISHLAPILPRRGARVRPDSRMLRRERPTTHGPARRTRAAPRGRAASWARSARRCRPPPSPAATRPER